LSQKRHDKNKIYSIRAPEVECISKGKAHKKYEFGVVGMKAYHGSPYDGHTLNDAVIQTERISGLKARDIYVDRVYRGHNYTGEALVHIAGRGTKKLKASIFN
jgi:IS5 family transposase